MMGGRKTMVTVLAAVTAPMALHAEGAGISPGQWQMAVTINSMKMPGAPAGVSAMMAGRTTKIRHCITAEEAARGPQELLKTNSSCSFTHYSMAGGKLSSEMVCKQGRGTTTATSNGSYTPVSFTATGRAVTTGEMPMTIATTTVGSRIGDCKK